MRLQRPRPTDRLLPENSEGKPPGIWHSYPGFGTDMVGAGRFERPTPCAQGGVENFAQS